MKTRCISLMSAIAVVLALGATGIGAGCATPRATAAIPAGLHTMPAPHSIPQHGRVP